MLFNFPEACTNGDVVLIENQQFHIVSCTIIILLLQYFTTIKCDISGLHLHDIDMM